MIEIKNGSYSIGNKTILKNINLTIAQGEVLVILGPNGAGKSTLLKNLTGSLTPDIGQVFFKNRPIQDYSIQELSKLRAVLSQSTPINFPFTSWEIVMMGRSPHLLDHETPTDHKIASDVLQTLDAFHLKDRIFSTLSGGEQQRIQFARVLAQIWDQENACLFLDEPIASLDLKHQFNILELTRDLSRTRKYAVCIVLHDMNMAKYYADRAILLKAGKTFACGEVENVLSTENITNVFDIPVEYANRWMILPP